MPSDINLLPETEREKAGEKKKPVVIEMTMPEGYAAPKKKQGGVLQFFKSVFRKPKPIPQEPPPPPKPAAHRAVPLERGRSIAGKPQIKFTPTEAIESPVPAPAEREAILREIGSGRQAPASWTSSETSERGPLVTPGPMKPLEPQRNGEAEIKIPPRIPPPPMPESGAMRPTKPEVRYVPSPAGTRMEKEKGPSLWSRFAAWLNKLFAPRPKVAKIPTPPPPAPPPPPPMPKVPQASQVPPAPMPHAQAMPATVSKETPPAVPPASRVLPVPPAPPAPPVVPPLVSPAPPQPEEKKQKREVTKPEEMPGYTSAPILQHGRLRDVNLVPEELVDETQPAKRLRVVWISGISALVLVILAYIGLVVYQRTVIGETETIEEEIAQLNTQIAAFDQFRKESDAVRRHIEDLEILLDRHVHWGEFFSLLETHILPEVYLTSLTVDAQGTVSVNAVASTTDAVARQLTLLKRTKDFATEVSISGITPLLDSETQLTSGYGFTLSIMVSPELFRDSR